MCLPPRPLPARLRVDLEHPRRAKNCGSLGQAHDDPRGSVRREARLPWEGLPRSRGNGHDGRSAALAGRTARRIAIGAEIEPAKVEPMRTVSGGAGVERVPI